MNLPVLSIIVPVYNVRAYLEVCVESLIAREMRDVEIILVDDGSTDGSGALCDALARRYACVRCIHKENEGVSAARNDGLNEAKGKYVLFVDADDLIEPNGMDGVLQWAQENQADICFLQIQDLYPDGVLKEHGDNIVLSEVRVKTKEEVFSHLASRPKFPGSVWAKAFRREFLLENQFRFIKGRQNGEDLSFMMECFLAAQRFDALDMPFYQYRRNRDGSATHQSSEQKCNHLYLFITEWTKRLTQNQMANAPLSTYAMSFVAYEYTLLLWQRVNLTGDALKQADVFLREYSWVMRYAKSRKIRAIGIFQKVLGTKRVSWLLKRIKERNLSAGQ